MAKATIKFNDSTALYECITEFSTYAQVHVSGDYGLFQKEANERFNCLAYANGEAHEVKDGEEHEIDGMTYVATVSGWKESKKINAQDYVNSIEFPCFFFAGNGAPAGQAYAILENTALPVDLADVEGEIEADGGFVCTNHDDGKGGWNHSDHRGNTITKIQIYSDKQLWEREHAEWMGE